MLVSGLQNALLSQIISSKSANYSDLHDALCQCVRDMLAKYKQKPASGKKLAIKTRAAEKLLRALCEVPKDQRVIRATILSALKSYAEALQGYEHLLSVKGNTYALIEQTQGLIKEHDNISVSSLLQYHHLKNKLLGPDTRLSDEQREVISELAENKDLTLKMLETLLEYPRAHVRVLVRLHQAGLLEPGLLEPDFYVRVLNHQHSSNAAAALVKLYQHNLLKPALCAEVLECENHDTVDNMKASATELRYYELKNKFFGPDTPLDDEQKKVLSELYKNKDLTLKMLEAIDEDFPSHSRALESPGISGTATTLANIPAYIHIDIMNAMKKAGYHPFGGVCYGIAWAALLACVRGGGQAYMERMQYLKQMHIPPLRRADAHQVYPFFDVVTLSQTNYQYMTGYAEGIGYPGRQEIAFPGSIVKSHLPGYQVVPVVRHRFIAEFIPERVIEFLEQTLENNKGIPFGVMISYINHASGIGFDGNKWLAANHDYHYYTKTTELLYTFLDKQSYYHKNGRMIAAMELITGNEYALNITNDALVVNAKKSVSVPVVLHLALQYGDVNITNDCITVIGQQAHSPETLLEQLTFKGAEGTPGFFVALQNGHHGAITVFIQASAVVIARLSLSKTEKAGLLYELLASKRNNGTPGFYMALQKGHTDAITAFIQESALVVARLPLSKTEKANLLYKLLGCKGADDIPGFFMTLQSCHTGAITAFIKASAAAATMLSLPDKKVAELLYELLASKGSDGVPGFYMALQKGHTDAITAFIQESALVVARLPLLKTEKANLIYKLLGCKRTDDIPGFFTTLQSGHTGAITAFIKASAAAATMLSLLDKKVAELLYELLASKDSDGVPGFFMTLQNCHTDAITAFVQESAVVVAGLPLLKKEKAKLLYELLGCKRANDIPGFFMTLQSGHTDAITAFIKASAAAATTLSLSDKEIAELLYELLACKDSNGMPGFFIAFRYGLSGAITAFIQEVAAVITRLSLSETEIAKWLCKLLTSKTITGVPGFFMALLYGHSGAITAFIQASAAVIARLPLSKTEKGELLYELLVSKRNDDIPGFYITLRNGHVDAITAFIQANTVAAATLSDSEEERTERLYELFHRLENENKPLFLLALKKGGPAVQQAFTEGIDQLPLSDEKKETLKYPTLDFIENMHIS